MKYKFQYHCAVTVPLSAGPARAAREPGLRQADRHDSPRPGPGAAGAPGGPIGRRQRGGAALSADSRAAP
eukprot:523774-Prorocentrum_minimum.AAC.1